MADRKRVLPKRPGGRKARAVASTGSPQARRPAAAAAAVAGRQDASASKVKVVVRVRPLNDREKRLESGSVVTMKGQKTVITHPTEQTPKGFYFDKSIWSCSVDDEHYVGQPEMFNLVGRDALENAFQGYNACIFAYGQTGSGKTYTMMGYDAEKGVVPRLCDAIFDRIEANRNEHLTYKVEVSYLEIYNERVQDLLGDPKARKNLRVREHSALGPYVEGLSKLAVTTYGAVQTLMEAGNRSRTTAATLMNDRSSRSHAVFTLTLTQAQFDPVSKQTGEKVAKISLVDLAGSERFSKTGTTGERLKEGANINQSLSTLGQVISALAEQSRGKKKFVPYRDSILTWLLKDNLGGNSKTVMVATISPSENNYHESLSTLYYAHRAKSIVNHAIVNEDPTAKIIRELREELEMLRAGVGVDKMAKTQKEVEHLKAQLARTENLIQEMTMSWEEKLKNTEAVIREKEELLRGHGASVSGAGDRALKLDVKLPHFVGLSSDPFSGGVTIYTFKEGLTTLGTDGMEPANDIALGFADACARHCEVKHSLRHNAEEGVLQEVVVLIPKEGDCAVDDVVVSAPTELYHGSSVVLGADAVYRFNHPTEAERMRRKGGAPPHLQKSPSAALLAPNPIVRKREEELQQLQAEAARKQREETELLRAEMARQHELDMQKLAAERELTLGEKRKTQEAEARAERERIEKEIEAHKLKLRLAELEERMYEEAARAEEERAHRLQLEHMGSQMEELDSEKSRQLQELQELSLAQAAHSQQLLAMQAEANDKVLRRQQELEAQEEQRRVAEDALREKERLIALEQERQAEAMKQLAETQARLEEERLKLETEKYQRERERMSAEEARLRLELESTEKEHMFNEQMADQWEQTEAMLREKRRKEAEIQAEMERRAYEKAKRELELKEDAERQLREAHANSAREQSIETLIALTGISRRQCGEALDEAQGDADRAAAELFRLKDEEKLRRQEAESLRLAHELAADPEVLPRAPEPVIANCSFCKQDVVRSDCFGLDCCDHKFHRTCLIVYVQDEVAKLRNPIPCPDNSCDRFLTEADIQAHVDRETYENYIVDCTANVINSSEAMTWCPTPDCGYAVEYKEGRDNPRFVCPVCNKSYCLRCKTVAHPAGVSCQDYQSNPFLSRVAGSTPSLAQRMMQQAQGAVHRLSPQSSRRDIQRRV